MRELPRLLAQEITDLLGQVPAVGLLGPRQVGKSTLARQLAADRGDVLVVDLQDRRLAARLSEPEAVFEANRERLVVLDEIQRAPELFGVLRPEIDAHRHPGRFLLLGSASPRLIRAASESLAGRIFYTELTPLSLPEVLAAGHDQRDHLTVGGYPEPLLHLRGRARRLWARNYLATFVTRDLNELGYAPNVPEFERLLAMLAHAHGGAYNASELSRSLRISASTVQRYVDLLEGAFLIRVLRPYLANVRKRLTKQPRLYWRDSGLRHHLLGIADYDELLLHPALGSAWEGYAIEEVCRALGPEARPSFYRTATGAELDLVVELSSTRRIAFEVKFSVAPRLTRGFYAAVGDVSPERTFVLTPDAERFDLRDDVTVCSLQTFLTAFAAAYRP